MGTLLDIKNTYAQERGYEDWHELYMLTDSIMIFQMHMNEICIRAQKAYRDNILQKIHNISFAHNAVYIETLSSITNPENLIR